MDVLNALKRKQDAHFMQRFKRKRIGEADEAEHDSEIAKRLRTRWPVHTCPECKQNKHNLFGHQICDDCKDLLFADASEDDDEKKTVYTPFRWALPVVRPCFWLGAVHDYRGWQAQGTVAYMQPAPVSGFPYTLPQDDNFEDTHDPHPLEAQCYDAYSETASHDIYVVYKDLDTDEVTAIEQPWEMEWDHLLQFWGAVGTPFTEEQIVRGRDLLFRVPFLQEQPHLGLLMVHSTANQQRFRNTVGQLADQTIGHVLYRDVLSIVLSMAYEPSFVHA